MENNCEVIKHEQLKKVFFSEKFWNLLHGRLRKFELKARILIRRVRVEYFNLDIMMNSFYLNLQQRLFIFSRKIEIFRLQAQILQSQSPLGQPGRFPQDVKLTFPGFVRIGFRVRWQDDFFRPIVHKNWPRSFEGSRWSEFVKVRTLVGRITKKWEK